MGPFAERLLALVLAAGLSGCVSGHVLDAARRREVPARVTAAALDGDDLVVVVETTTVTDLDRPTGRGTTRARVPLAALHATRPVDELPVCFEPAGRPLPGTSLAVVETDATVPAGAVAHVSSEPPATLRLAGANGEVRVLYLAALTRSHYRPWAWALMPMAVGVDAVIVPPLLALAPVVMVLGD